MKMVWQIFRKKMTLLNKLNKKYWNELIKYKNNSKYIEWNIKKEITKNTLRPYTYTLHYYTYIYMHIEFYFQIK